ncbi:MAG TPA: DUF2849 domain-containing protein [Roseiarcus sp.]|nr:DUF2849 domain-containing protein [Roseiarcus sp.]
MSEVITANRLIDGIVVFQAENGWVEDFAQATIYDNAEASKQALARAKEDEARDVVVDSYAIVVEMRSGHYAPKALREIIRAAGPTTRPDLGKQAQGQSPRFVEGR